MSHSDDGDKLSPKTKDDDDDDEKQ